MDIAPFVVLGDINGVATFRFETRDEAMAAVRAYILDGRAKVLEVAEVIATVAVSTHTELRNRP